MPRAIREQHALDSVDLSVIGAGYVGLVTAACLARLGHRVTVLEVSPERIAALRAGRLPFYELGLSELVVDGLAAGRLRVTDQPADALPGRDAILVCVGTPSDAHGSVDLTQLESGLASIASFAPDATVVVRSTLPPGVSASLADRLGRTDTDRVVTNPEFLREGSAISDFMAPTRIVIGTADGRRNDGARIVERVYSGLTAPVILTDFATAEMIKNASNAFLATRLSFINEIADLCEAYGADIDRVVEGMGLDPRIGPRYLRPGIGFGGSCLPKELSTLIGLGRRTGLALPQLRAADEANRARIYRVAERLDDLLGGLAGRRIALLGLSFKPQTDDTRSSPALGLAAALLARGASVVAHDPAVPADHGNGVTGLERARDAESALVGADLVVLATEWSEYLDLDWRRLARLPRRALVFDGRNALDASSLRAAGWTVVRVGEAEAPPVIARGDAAREPSGATNVGSNGHPHRAASRVNAQSEEMRFLLYSHDAVGLGHVRRNLILAGALAERAPRAGVLVASGAEGLECLSVPPGVDVLRLPGLRKDRDGHYVGRRLKVEPEDVLGIRAGILESVVEDFRPDVLLADKHPIGVGGELLPAIRAVRHGGGRAALGLRDVLDDPADAAAEWRRDGTAARVAELHDMVLVYGNRSLLAPLPDRLLPTAMDTEWHFCGYVVDDDHAHGRGPPDLPRGERPLVLAVTGGGEDGRDLLEAFIEASRTAPWRGAVVGGPQMDPVDWVELESRAHEAGVDALRAVHDLHRWFPHVAGIVCMGGYNTLVEAVSSGTPTVCVPRIRPRREQLIRARAFAARGLIHVIEPSALSGDRLRRVLESALRTPRAVLAQRAREALDLGGAERAATLLVALAEDSTRTNRHLGAVTR